MIITEIFRLFFQIVQIILLVYLVGTSVYLLVFGIASLFPMRKKATKSTPKRRFAILIPCYKEDEVIFDVAEDAMFQNYPKELFDIIIIADKFDPKTIKKLRELPIIVFDEAFEISTKTRSINHALRQLPDNKYDAVCILDADNIMDNDFLNKIDASLAEGYVAVQGHRLAKNMNTAFAVLDALSEEINNQIFRKGMRVLGLSSALIGSAMAFDYVFFKELMEDIEVVGGFDKELELRLLKNGYVIQYVPDAIVFDEKVQNVKVFSQQRRRWISAQFHYFGKHFIPATKALLKHGNIEYFNKAVQYIQLPRVLLLGVLFILSMSSALFDLPIYPVYWIGGLISIILALLLAVPRRFYNLGTLKSILVLPIGFLFMFISLLNIRGANKKFIHTKHTYNAFQIKKRKQR